MGVNMVRWPLALAAAGLLFGAGCSAPASGEGDGDAEVGVAREALVNGDEFLYFRCNATSWGADETSRLKSTGTPGVFSLTYNVSVPWMVAQDQCVLLKTNQLDGWGSSNSLFTDGHPGTALNVPASDTFVAGGTNFNVHYPAAGAYTVTVNWPAGTFRIASAAVPTFNLVGHVSTANASFPSAPPASLPAINVNLGGNKTQSLVTDANGNFRFQVPAGNYTLTAVGPSGSSILPVNRNNAPATDPTVSFSLAGDTLQDFFCTGTCAAPSNIVSAKELVITDPSVTQDARASSAGAVAGPWSFRAMLEQMTPVGTDPADFANAWLGQFEIAGGAVNGFPLSVRATSNLRSQWPLAANGKLDLSKAPFQLLAIVNRVDVSAQGNGEGRFVYGLTGQFGGQLMTVIFEYGLPSTDVTNGAALTRNGWAAKFHALGSQPFGSAYNSALQSVTDLFSKRNTSPSKPGGSSINQVRSNEIVMGGPWQLREFHLTNLNNTLGLRVSATANTPVNSAVTSGTAENAAIVSYINGNSVLLHGGYAAFPSATLGGEANEDFSWTSLTGVEPSGRHVFAGMTCNGCHNSETSNLNLDGFYQISPVAAPGADGTGRLAPFIKGFEIPRRTAFLQNLLTCSGSTCSAGAEAMFTQ